MAKVLVTGASGYIGRHCLQPLLEQGYEVHAQQRTAVGVSSVDRSVAWHTVDLLDPVASRQLLEKLRPELLMHLAWHPVEGQFWRATENLDWVTASIHLLRRFLDAGGKRAIVAGTCAEYDWQDGLDGVFREDAPQRPATLYGACKAGLGQIAQGLFELRQASLVWARVFFLYGPGQHPDRLVSSVTRALLRGKEAPVSQADSVRDFLHVRDVASAFVALLSGNLAGAVNIGSGQPATVREVVDALAAILARQDLVRYGSSPRPHRLDAARLVADTRRLNHEAGWQPRFDLAAGLRDTVEWWRAHPEV